MMRIAPLIAIISLHWTTTLIEGFVPIIPTVRQHRQYTSSRRQSKEDDPNEPSTIEPKRLYPVISQIGGMEFTGSCRYINAELTPLTSLKLSGGAKYEIEGTTVTLSSYLTFPNGQTRNVIMKGSRNNLPERNAPEHEVITLEPIDEGGPILMKLSEVYPDTILINEVEKATGKIVMTSSINIVRGVSGSLELVGVSHEVGDDNDNAIEGHQIWRMTASSSSTTASDTISFDEFDFRSATSW
mmetsp:Transcript_26954/g.45926  ORF Transcript_26954/g.45926 Transcript_26954/m.45926 type:complete len:242 (-) Transcript_26954:248-973(-)|eukprot:CAMPEP_0183730196 /NCGR_PEP_ID=MMETSP0737-20130205/32207_1 /TAXON_ID=385413 /ORGANISM="Thalassiosira miniscula, Strain CCMP1093" /LENGTH=241 /DNA_ID=CAMNT_0025962619 /DNA_START=283 /DNA_END=1005 /DNA_ORIENTATION=-